MLKRLRPLTLIAVALLAGALALPAHALQFNYSTRLTLTDCDTADESGFNTGMTALCYDLTAQRDEIWNGSAWVAYLGAGSSSSSPAYMTIVDSDGDSAVDATANAVRVTDNNSSLTVDGALSIIGNTVNVEASFTRPADTTAYAAGDVISNSTSSPSVITFSNVAAAGLGGVITDVVVSDSAAQSTKLEAELWLFHTAPAATNDNAAFAISDAEADDVLCLVPLGSGYGSVGGGNFVYHVRNLGCAFEVAGSGTDIYGVLVARNAYTPVSGEVFNIRLHVLKD